MKSVNLFFSLLFTFALGMVLVSCQPSRPADEEQDTIAANTLQFTNYSNLKLGFTTQNFLLTIPVSQENAKGFVDYAQEMGFSWIELRDPNADLSPMDAQAVSTYAKEKGIEVSYAIQKGLLDQDFWPTFKRGLANAIVFEGPGTYRMLIGASEYAADTSKLGWTEEELATLVEYADSAANLAANQGLQLVLENSVEAFDGQEGKYFGLTDFFERTNDKVGWQFDTANPFSVSRVTPAPNRVAAYLKTHADNLFYIHLKSSVNHASQAYLTENPLAFDLVFQTMSENEVPYVAIELQGVEDKDAAYANHQRSVDYLKEKGFLGQ